MTITKRTEPTNEIDGDQTTDLVIVKMILAGDVDQYERIMRRYNQRLYRIARSILLDDSLALDAVQEAHIKAYQKLERFEGDKGFAGWLATIAKNEALMMLRKIKSEKSVFDHTREKGGVDNSDGKEMNKQNDRSLAASSSPQAAAENQQLRKELNKHIDSLPANFRTVFVMRGIEELSTRETAEILNIREATVKTRFYRAKSLLQKEITNQYGSEVYGVGGCHCDLIVSNVMKYIRDRLEISKSDYP